MKWTLCGVYGWGEYDEGNVDEEGTVKGKWLKDGTMDGEGTVLGRWMEIRLWLEREQWI